VIKLLNLRVFRASLNDYRDVHCTQRVDGDFDLLVHIEDTGGPSNLDTLCKQLERLYNVVSAEKVGRRKRAERA